MLPVHFAEGAQYGLVVIAIPSDCSSLHAPSYNIQWVGG